MADSKESELNLIETPAIDRRIFVIRGRQVMLDEDLADLYGVQTKVLIQQVKRNAKRFPHDFMFQLTKSETEASRSQIVTSNQGRGGRRYAPYVFTEQGIAMLSDVLRSSNPRRWTPEPKSRWASGSAGRTIEAPIAFSHGLALAVPVCF